MGTCCSSEEGEREIQTNHKDVKRTKKGAGFSNSTSPSFSNESSAILELISKPVLKVYEKLGPYKVEKASSKDLISKKMTSLGNHKFLFFYYVYFQR